MCIRIYIFLIKEKKTTRRRKAKKKKKKKKEKKRISFENLTGYDNIVCANLLCLLFYLIESWIFHGCSYDFGCSTQFIYPGCFWLFICSLCTTTEITVYVIIQQLMKYTYKNKNKTKSLRDISVYHFLLYICLFVAANLL